MLKSDSSTPPNRAPSCCLIPRYRSCMPPDESLTTGMLRVLLIVPANFGSETINFCSIADLLFLLFLPSAPPAAAMDEVRNSCSEDESRPSWIAVISSTAEAVDANRWMAWVQDWYCRNAQMTHQWGEPLSKSAGAELQREIKDLR